MFTSDHLNQVNNNILLFLLLFLITSCNVGYVVNNQQTNTGNCEIYKLRDTLKMEYNVVFTKQLKENVRLEVRNFYDSTYKYDILFYSAQLDNNNFYRLYFEINRDQWVFKNANEQFVIAEKSLNDLKSYFEELPSGEFIIKSDGLLENLEYINVKLNGEFYTSIEVFDPECLSLFPEFENLIFIKQLIIKEIR